MSRENSGNARNYAVGDLVGTAVGLVGTYLIDRAFPEDTPATQTLRSVLETGVSRVTRAYEDGAFGGLRSLSGGSCSRHNRSGSRTSPRPSPRAVESSSRSNGSGSELTVSELRSRTSDGDCCAICLDSVSQTITTPCCRQLLHVGCHGELRNRQVTVCPLCRAPWS